MTETPPGDENTDYGRYTPEPDPRGEDRLTFLILRMLQQACEQTAGEFDSWATSAYEAAILELTEQGLIELDKNCGRIYVKLTEKGRHFETWMEHYDRLDRIREAKHILATVPGMTAEQIVKTHGRFYGFGAAALIDWSGCPDIERVPGRCGGEPVVVGTRILAEGIIENVAGGVSIDELLTDVFPDLTRAQVERIIVYAREHGVSV
jgi:uncharacterized protein (DUF433 family)